MMISFLERSCSLLLLISALSLSALTQASPAEQLRCVVSRIYLLSEVGTLIQLDEGTEKKEQIVVKPGESSFFVETSRGVIMGDLSNIMFDKVEKFSARRISEEGLTLFMSKGEKTNYIWIDTISATPGRSELGKSVLWVDAPYIYTGVCR